jgi:serine/threonine protein phosphatase 1
MFPWLKPAPAPKPYIPDGQVVYAVGDLHGMADLTKAMVDKILRDTKKFPDCEPRLIFLGDFVDKGDHSKEVISLLVELSARSDVQTTFIKGNHEDALLTFLAHPSFGPQWVSYGGAQTLMSYGVTIPEIRSFEAAMWEDVAHRFKEALPHEHIDFLESLPTSTKIGNYFFVHAGVRPNRSLEDQEDGDLMWIRRQFLDDKRNFSAIIVHGHSPDLEAYQDHRRIGIDTGAYATGKLSAVRLMGASRHIVSVTRTSPI